MYQENDELIGHLRWALTHPVAAHKVSLEISKCMAQYDWLKVGNRYDSELELLTKI